MKALFELTFSNKDVQIKTEVTTEVTTEASSDTYLWFKAIAAANDRLEDLEETECASFSLENVRLIKYLGDT